MPDYLQCCGSDQKAKKVMEKLNIFKNVPLFLVFGQKRPWIRIPNPVSEIRIRIKIKPWIRIRIKAYADPDPNIWFGSGAERIQM